MLSLDASPFCRAHQPKPAALTAAAQLTAADLAEAAGALSTPAEIHRFQSKVTLLLIQGRISPKLANTYSYQVLTLFRGCRELARHEKLQAELAEREAEKAAIQKVRSWPIPRPDRSDPPDPPALTISESSNSSPASAADSNSASSSPAAGSVSTPAEQNPPKLATPAKPSPPPPPPPLPPDFYNHFHPIDPSLPLGAQDLSKSIPPPDPAECRCLEARRGLNFNRRRSQPVSRW